MLNLKLNKNSQKGGFTLKVASIRVDWGQDGFEEDISLEVVLSGCKRGIEGRGCEDCHNAHLWSFSVGEDFNEDFIRKHLERFKYDALIITGGEPLDQPFEELLPLVILGHQWCKKVILYTGYSLDEVKEKLFNNSKLQYIFKFINFIKIGTYDKNLPPKGKLASSNQAMYKVSNESGEFEFGEIPF